MPFNIYIDFFFYVEFEPVRMRRRFQAQYRVRSPVRPTTKIRINNVLEIQERKLNVKVFRDKTGLCQKH